MGRGRESIAAGGNSRCKGPVVGRTLVRATPERRKVRGSGGRGSLGWGGAGRDKPLRPHGVLALCSKTSGATKDLKEGGDAQIWVLESFPWLPEAWVDSGFKTVSGGGWLSSSEPAQGTGGRELGGPLTPSWWAHLHDPSLILPGYANVCKPQSRGGKNSRAH